jgi:Flp pilus assembly protein TadD
VLRFENLSGDPALDWIGRAFSDVIARELAAVPGIYAIPSARLHNLDANLGRRPSAAPGISSERDLAQGAGANRLAYGEFWLRNGRMEARLTLEQLPSARVAGVFTASAPAGDVLTAATAFARQISSKADAYPTRNAGALQSYIAGLEAADPALAVPKLEEAIRFDPDFGPPYDTLAQWKFRERDPADGLAVLTQALGRGHMAELDRVRIAVNAAELRGDAAARRQALVAWSHLSPEDPVVWRALAELEMNRHNYPQALLAFQKAAGISPEDPNLWNLSGYAAARAGDMEASTRFLQRYAALRPAEANPLDSLGDVNFLSGRLEQAEAFYLQAAKKDPAFEGGGDLLKAATARLMRGDLPAADALAKQFIEQRRAAHDLLADFYQADWDWVAGRRKEAYQGAAAFARSAESGPLRQAASEAYSELSIWSLALGDRAAAAQMADRAMMLAGPASAATAVVSRFVAQSPAAAEEWTARAAREFPQPAQKQVRDIALAYALLADRQFAAAAPMLQTLYDSGAANDDSTPVLLAWAYLETGRAKEASALLRFNPLPPGAGLRPFRVFYFPRLFYLRGRAAAAAGNSDSARAQYRLFLQFSGDQPLVWAEESRAR